MPVEIRITIVPEEIRNGDPSNIGVYAVDPEEVVTIKDLLPPITAFCNHDSTRATIVRGENLTSGPIIRLPRKSGRTTRGSVKVWDNRRLCHVNIQADLI